MSLRDYMIIGLGLACAGLASALWFSNSRADVLKLERDANVAEVARVHADLAAQKLAAERVLADANAETATRQALLDEATAEQTKKDAQNVATVDRYRDELRRARLRAAAAQSAGGGGGGAAEPIAPADGAANRAGDAPDAGGVVPSGADTRAFIADRINIAYSACRNTLLTHEAATAAQLLPTLAGEPPGSAPAPPHQPE